mgnify:CR=1 FL=1
MLCNICHRPELATQSDGTKTDSIRRQPDPKKSPHAFLCAHCTSIVGGQMSQIDWEMDLEGLKDLIKHGRPMTRRRKMQRTS